MEKSKGRLLAMELSGVGYVITNHQVSLLSSLKESFARAVLS